MKIKGKEEFLRQLRALPDAVRSEVTKALSASAEETTDTMQRFAPINSGTLRASIGYVFGDAPAGAMSTSGRKGKASADAARAAKFKAVLAVTIYAGGGAAWYARLVEFGTRAHDIKPRNKRALATNGKVIGAKVRHPGASRQPFFYPGYRIGRKRYRSRVQRAIRAGAKKAFS